MNGPNAHNGMNVSKTEAGVQDWGFRRTGSFLALLLLLIPSCAYAQGAAPGMSGVKEVVVHYARFTDSKTADTCALERESLANAINKTLTDNAVPAIPVATAKPPMMGVARIDLVPEISTIATQDLDCTSWVSLTAQTQNNVVVPPIEVLRNVKIVYWQQGLMVASPQSTHSDRIAEYLKKMALQFAQRYRMDQPPELPK